jgi:hypothetical protein
VRRRSVVADDSPASVFVREMKAALGRRLQARTAAARRAAQAEMEGIMRRHLGVGRGMCHVEREARDGKLAAAGVDRD